MSIIEEIKFLYFKRNIFFLRYKKKLIFLELLFWGLLWGLNNIIFHNKNLHENLGIDIKDYIKICGKYKICSRTRKGSVYILIANILKFEGEYLNGKRNGKWNEYYKNGKLKFEDGYLNGEKNGKGKEYKDKGPLKFEGEYVCGKRNGKEYYENDKLKFEGEYIKGLRNRKGNKYYYNGNLKFEGEYLNGKKMKNL